MSLTTTIKFLWQHPLNKSNRVAAITRYLRWQVGSRMLPGAIELPFVEGTKLFAKPGMTGATGNWYCGLHELDEMAFVLHMLRPCDCFLDVGANIGSYTILGAGAVGARTIAVEPIPSTFENLCRNVTLNGLENVYCYQGGLSDEQGALRLTSELDTVNHVLANHENVPNIEVPVTTLDDLMAENVPTLIKIDVEGHELSVLKGARKTLSNQKLLAVIMETNGSGARYNVTDDELINVIKGLGFFPYSYDPFSRKLIAGLSDGGNTIFIRDLEAVSKRVETAPRFTLVNGSI